MEEIRQYVLSVISVSILCGTVQLFFRRNPHTGIVNLICCLMVTITVMYPLLNGRQLSFDRYWEKISVDSSLAVRQGKEAAENAGARYIKEAMESYISSKAEEMGVVIQADVELHGDDLKQPNEVVITGRIPPYAKRRISQIIESDLGIAEEKQIWIS